MSIEHSDAPAGEIHLICNFSYANAAARTGATVTADDIGKFAEQVDNNSVWMLIDDSPVTWIQISPGSGALQAPSGVNDANGNEVVKFGSTASAVNEVTVTNKATGNGPTVAASGGDTNIDLVLLAKGSGKVVIGSASLKFPNTDGSSGHVLQTNGSGVLSFGAVPSGGAPGGSAGGDLTGTYPNPTLATAGPGATGPIGDGTHVPVVTIDAKGRVTALTSTSITGAAPTGSAGGDLSGTYPNPRVAQINDANGNELLKFGTTASAVNEVTITNKDTGNAPTIAATGNDTDIDLSLVPKGAGRVKTTDFEVTESLRWSGDLSPSQITSDQNDYSPTNLADNTVLRLDTDSNSGAGRSITGLAGGADGRIITIVNIGSNPLRLKAENSSSSAANRFGFAIDLVLGSKRSAVLWYDSTSSRWRLLSTTAIPLRHTVAISDETTALTAGTAKLTFRFATAVYLLQVRANLNTVSSSGDPAFDVNEAGASIFSTTVTIDANEKTSESAATPAAISDPNIADDAEMTVDIDTAGTGAKGAKLTFVGWEI